MPQLSITLLGSFQVLLDGKPLTAFATDKARALLAYLAVEASHPHRREALAALLWPDQPEQRARHNLRQALSHLRQTLGDADASALPFLLVERDTVQFNPEADVFLDVAEFAALTEATRKHRHQRPERCLPCLQRQQRLAALYQGGFLGQFFVPDSALYEEWALLKREWLHHLAMGAFAVLSDYHERRGEFRLAHAYAQRQVELEPWREEAHCQLMRLLAREGQRGAALAQYEVCRRVLQAEFAAAPATETTRLFEQIKAEAQEYSKEHFLSVSPPLPVPALFVGRETELAELAELLADPACRLITLTGPGGIGKSCLAQRLAELHRGLFADGVFFVSLSAAADMNAVAVALADALALPSPLHGASRWLFQQLRHKELLLVLDDFEHLVDCCELLSALLREAPHLMLVVTSREKLRLQEEWVYALEGLRYPATLPARLEEARTFSALVLFQRRAMQVHRHFELTEETLPDVIRICQLVEGLPLGVALAAAATAERSCAEIAAALAHTLDVLQTTLRNMPARHHSLRAAFEHSWALLTPAEQASFTALAVFVTGFDAEAAREVVGAPDTVLAALTAKSLLSFDGGRYLWHEATHQYAAEHLAADPARAQQLGDRHCAAFAARAQRAGAQGDGAADDLAGLERDRGNFKAAWNWALAYRKLDCLEAMSRGMGLFYQQRGPAQEGAALFAAALEQLASEVETVPSLAAHLCVEQARLLALQARYAQAVESAARLAALGRRLGSAVFEATGYLLQGQTFQQQGKNEEAQQALEAALAHSVAAPKAVCLKADVLRELGNVAARRGERSAARRYYEDALNLYRELGNQRGESAVLNNLGSLACDCGDYAGAQAYLTSALALYRAWGNLPGEAKALNNLANVAADQRDYSTALQHYRAALRIHQVMENSPAQGAALNNLGALYWELGLYAEARAAYRQALAIYRASDNLQAEGESLANLSLVELRTGDLRAASQLAQQAAAAALRSDDALNLANAYTYLGKIHTALAQRDEAERWYRQALAIREAIPHPGRLLELQAELAYLTWQRGDPIQALADIAPVLAALQDESALEGAEEPYQVYWICCEILRANADSRAAPLLALAQQQLLAQAARISDPELRRAFLRNVPAHRRVSESCGSSPTPDA